MSAVARKQHIIPGAFVTCVIEGTEVEGVIDGEPWTGHWDRPYWWVKYDGGRHQVAAEKITVIHKSVAPECVAAFAPLPAAKPVVSF